MTRLRGGSHSPRGEMSDGAEARGDGGALLRGAENPDLGRRYGDRRREVLVQRMTLRQLAA